MTGFAAETPAQPAPKPAKTVEERYSDGLECLKQADAGCAQATLAMLPPASPYAKILDAQIAATARDDERVLRLLLPLQGNANLLPQAIASLHATLAQAYENQGNTLRAIEQLQQIKTEDTEAIHQRIWRQLKSLPRETLLELRGESQDTLTQGWVDLAIAAASKSPANAVSQWRSAYPDHPVSAAFLQQLSLTEPAATNTEQPLGDVALLLPLNESAYETAAAAFHAGLMAARGASATDVRVYPTTGSKAEIVAIYQKAVAEGAQYVVGPMTREEVTALAASGLKLVPTLTLNNADQPNLPENLTTFGMPVETEVAQSARLARALGMQSAIVVASDNPLSRRMVQAFLQEWKAQEGTLVAEKNFGIDTNLAELKADLGARSADMIFLAATSDEARLVRPYLDAAIPTFSTSHIYDGVEQNPENVPLTAIHFVDMPWMVNQDHPDFAPYREAADKLPPGEAQRWFAVGVDAWHILAAKAAGKSLLLPGLSGTLHMEGNSVVRDLPMAQFRAEGVVLENTR